MFSFLDQIANAAVEAVNDPSILSQPENAALTKISGSQDPAVGLQLIQDMFFLPDEGDSSPEVNTEVMRQVERGTRAADILRQLENEIGS